MNWKFENTKPISTMQKSVQTSQYPQQVQGKLIKGYENPRITFNGKTHSLPTMKEYIMKEYADVFKGIGMLPGPPYHIELKDEYTPVRHAARSVPVGMQEAYKA